jgi:uncharacterized membrane protein
MEAPNDVRSRQAQTCEHTGRAMVQGVTIGGLPIPSRDPSFLAAVAIHVAAGVVAVVAGAIAMLSPKAPGRHPRSGVVYFRALVVVTLTMIGLAIVRWPSDNALAAIGLVAIATATLGRRARRLERPGWRRIHIPAMGGSYIALLTAFYVDNGPHLPVWNRLPTIAFWTLPAIVGAPIITIAWRKYVRRAA